MFLTCFLYSIETYCIATCLFKHAHNPKNTNHHDMPSGRHKRGEKSRTRCLLAEMCVVAPSVTFEFILITAHISTSRVQCKGDEECLCFNYTPSLICHRPLPAALPRLLILSDFSGLVFKIKSSL